MHFSTLLAFATLSELALANNNSAYGFTVNIYPVFEGYPLTNHPLFVGYPVAVDYKFAINTSTDEPQTFCPPKVQAAGACPTPTPSDVKTQFNTTLDQDGPAGEVYLNAAVPGGQQLYVQQDGLLRYTRPNRSPPADSYTDLFTLNQHYDGSQLEFSNPTLLFNGSLYFYSCLPAVNNTGALNLTYAPTPAADLSACTAVALLSDALWFGTGYAACPENPLEDASGNLILPQCGYAAYAYD
ncbi:MAG: hypothetical protein M1821_008590 [Bathelium mastoideum]|nr:MAG: hypothetical protein M1821_008590 [Bathelium mastoideum]